jgi:predicted ATP-dependent serine protease
VDRKKDTAPVLLDQLVLDDRTKVNYFKTKFDPLDDVLGGGIVRDQGQVILLGGQRGSGKTTLLLQVADGVAKYKKVLYAVGEMSAIQLGGFARRAGIQAPIEVLDKDTGAKQVELILERAREMRAFLVVFDSLQSLICADVDSPAGSPGQGLACGRKINVFCKSTSTCAIIVNQLDKQGRLAGSEGVGHEVDTIVSLAFPDDKFEADKKLFVRGEVRDRGIRVLSVDDKHRFGPEDIRVPLLMTDNGLTKWEQPEDDEPSPRRLKRRVGWSPKVV